ncbi:MmcQ/YjbR family DNA-binding protein [Stutzerimonas nosocomialis]|uniref:MmcQ/YjbR family DNA-binding protein n=1 Tax=Stutzerimonas nosocomialis TaxID=1056496 RepID=UPI001107BC4B|nr:MmcQ/YjbR family DNA-binding protein [Stutzerimonas nosocomialis]TLX61327.1 MmcQ/YjbR family DNA-binding protein [Stutzerimonas nosocomialis]
MSIDDIERFCLQLPGTHKRVQWGGVHVFSVGERKMFATLHLSGAGALAFKVDDDHFLGFCDRPGFRPAPYLARARWVSLDRPGVVAAAELKDLLTRSHQLVVARLPKRQRVGLLL